VRKQRRVNHQQSINNQQSAISNLMFRSLVLSTALVAAGLVAGVVITGRMHSTEDSLAQQTRSRSEPPALRPGPVASAVSSGGPDFTRIAGLAVKGVANISSLQIVRTRNSPQSADPFFRYFFGDDEFFGPRDRASRSLGSGVIISADGYVVTNNHVVGENNGRAIRTEVTIALPDKREIRGKIVGIDQATDIALLKIDQTSLPVIPWGDSNQLKVGEWVLAIGSPFQLSQTVTAGIVSATGRADLGFTQYEDFIQTDAAINPGNSGGALVNSRGELVGINTGIYSESGGYQGIGFAVPSNLAKKVVDDLMKYGEVRRGSIGYVAIEKLTPEFAREVGAPNTSGALIARMTRDSEAYDAGIRPGDVVVAFNGQPIIEPSQFLRMVADARVGSTATVSVLREGRRMEFRLPIVSSSRARR
jgi:serine protease Do